MLSAHSEKERAAGNYKGGFGFHPLLCYLAETGEPLAAVLRPATPAPTPPPITSRCCSSPSSSCRRKTFTARSWRAPTSAAAPTPSPRTAATPASASRSAMRSTRRVREAILGLPESAWQPAIDAEGAEREGARVTELTDRLDLSAWPEGTRLIVRRERPHPGAQFEIFDEQGYRHTAFITDQDGADIAALELRHRRRARVEDRIRTGKETGMRNLPHHAFEHNQAWLEVSLIAQALLALGRAALPGRRARIAEPKRLRQRLLHVAGRIVRHGRRTRLASKPTGPGRHALAAAFHRLRALPAPP